MRRSLLALLCVSLLAPVPAHAYRASGDGFWREPVVTYSDHTAGSYVFDARGRLRLFERYGTPADALRADLKRLLDGA